MVPCVPYVFNIINFETPGSQFKQGMQPVLFSVKEAETCGRGWVRAAENVTYFANKYNFRDVSPVKRRHLHCIIGLLIVTALLCTSMLTAGHAHVRTYVRTHTKVRTYKHTSQAYVLAHKPTSPTTSVCSEY